MNERQMTLDGFTVIYHAFEWDKEERKVDFSQALNKLEQVVGDLIHQGKPRLVAIEGASGSGKTGFARLLQHQGVNVKSIDVLSLCENAMTGADISHLLGDRESTYVIDELGYADKNCLPLIKSLVENGGTAVVLAQSRRDLEELDSVLEVKWLKLERSGAGSASLSFMRV